MGERNVCPRPALTLGVYRHYKGGTYEAYGLSQDEATGIWCVLYRNRQSGLTFHRPYTEWQERFTYVPPNKPEISDTPDIWR